ncbi:hypothetical protein FISHEDRAFT_72106 [Fistulina hepatica ATCC 64428]|uniref:Protein kinase domain-containing protein n=1 Tax=Fistulina hepatica ATCC 64428 TaxID=1128425 RepID=A0A0D7AF94_9AGAR|nr:hypothetical protein FISHEDRAFT_72106 [Fistulina hepatica ATCC 64428]
MSDNMPVMLKVLDGPLQYGDVDVLIFLFLSKNIIIIVLPVLKHWDSPPFEKVGQALDFVLQIAQTLDFLHEHNIAHGDLYSNNIMLDGSLFHPQQFHPVEPWLTPDGQRLTPTLSRSQVPRASLSSEGEIEPWDVFKLDIYTFGNFIRTKLIQKYSNLIFLEPLVDYMAAAEPQSRPDARCVVDTICHMCINGDPPFLDQFLLHTNLTGAARAISLFLGQKHGKSNSTPPIKLDVSPTLTILSMFCYAGEIQCTAICHFRPASFLRLKFVHVLYTRMLDGAGVVESMA